MANFETLKTAIDANINTNGKQAITGSVVNNVMHQMVDATSEQLTELGSEINARLALGMDNAWIFYANTISSLYASSGYAALIPMDGYDCFLIKTNGQNIVVQNAIPSQYVFYDRLPIQGKSDGYLKYNTSGVYVDGAKYCVINFKHDNNIDGYADIIIGGKSSAADDVANKLSWKVVYVEFESNIAAEINALSEGTYFLNTYSNNLGVRVGNAGWVDHPYQKNELYIIRGIPHYYNGEKLQSLNSNSKIWSEKKWVCVGDSLTEINSRTSIHYFDYISENTGISIVNMGIGGTGYMDEQDKGNAFYQRILDIDTSADVVTIFGSGNDLSHPLGEFSDNGTNTICGCINQTIDNLFAVFPLANVGIITPTPWGWYPPSLEDNKMANYANALVEICKRRGIPCLDLYHCSGLRPWDETYLPLCYSKDDGNSVHPDETGHKIIASKIQSFVEKLLLH